jgi:UDP-N-acetylmuramoylalanine--D-glutamate ligase
MDMKGRKVTIVGLARSGAGAANLLSRLGAAVTVTDMKSPDALKPFLNKLDGSIRCELGGHPHILFEDADLIVISPGVPMDMNHLKAASEKSIKIIGELELAYEIIMNNTPKSAVIPQFLAITGTNGKSTTTSLLYEMIKASSFKTVLGGNIGNAMTEEIYKGIVNNDSDIYEKDFFVAEVSSFQLESIREFRPTGAAILNITPDHLDRYSSMSSYIDAKCRIFLRQGKGDFIILNADDPATDEILLRMRAQESSGFEIPEIFYFSMKHPVEGAYYLDSDRIIAFNLPEYKIQNLRCEIKEIPPNFRLLPYSFKIKGVHNIENAMAASLLAILSGCKTDIISEVLKRYPGLEHRLEFVREIDGVRFINDSKGTNVGAVLKSLEGFHEPVILIAGGRDKHGDFGLLRPLIKEKVKALILIGEAREKIKNALGDLTRVLLEESLQNAVIKAKSISVSGDVVLLSPACASFDMFNDFGDRGRQFKKAVMEL